MKNIFTLIFIILNLHLVSSQQSAVVQYEFSYKKATDPPKNKMVADSRRTAYLSAEYAKDHQYILKFNPLESIYRVERSMPPDNVNKFEYKFSSSHFSRGIIYQNSKTNEVLNEKETIGKNFLVKSPLNIHWEITSETKYIGKYKCYKAISSCLGCNKNQIVTVWFTPDIPVPFGPAGFGGTPGLILEASKFRYTLTATNIKLTDKKLEIKKPDKGVEITAKELKELQMKARGRVMNMK